MPYTQASQLLGVGESWSAIDAGASNAVGRQLLCAANTIILCRLSVVLQGGCSRSSLANLRVVNLSIDNLS